MAHQEVGPAHQDWQEGGEAPEHQGGQEVCQPGGQIPAHHQSVSKAGKVRIEKPVEVTVMTRSRGGWEGEGSWGRRDSWRRRGSWRRREEEEEEEGSDQTTGS